MNSDKTTRKQLNTVYNLNSGITWFLEFMHLIYAVWGCWYINPSAQVKTQRTRQLQPREPLKPARYGPWLRNPFPTKAQDYGKGIRKRHDHIRQNQAVWSKTTVELAGSSFRALTTGVRSHTHTKCKNNKSRTVGDTRLFWANCNMSLTLQALH